MPTSIKPLVIITGASSGLGAAMAQAFSAAGYPLGLLARNIAAMQQLNLPHTICKAVDITQYNDVIAAIAEIEAHYGPVDCLINNAGFAQGGDFTTQAHEVHETMVNVNVLGVINGIEAVLPGMRARKCGTIINISSLADRSSRPQLATYAATKAAIKSLSESLRMANASYGIRVCNLAPAKVLTPMLIKANLDDDQLIQPQDFAQIPLWIYQQPQTICIRDLVVSPTQYEA